VGLDVAREAPIALVALGNTAHPASNAALVVEPLDIKTEPLSKTEVDYPAMRTMHEASALTSAAEVKGWRDGTTPAQVQSTKRAHQQIGRTFALHPLDAAALPNDSIEDVIVRRGSTREFAREPITFEQLSTVLERVSGGLATDFLTASEPSLNEIYLIVNAVTGLPSGAYFFQRDQRMFELLKEGDFRREAGHLGLGQEIPRIAASIFIFWRISIELWRASATAATAPRSSKQELSAERFISRRTRSGSAPPDLRFLMMT
jgi:hypothetical protein